uniref:Xaa-Pro aminopeptidase n=1 Tax=Eiseniibacteriota bacterium TaxID=2212470 RepID=A0A832I243_UNCEI
MDAFIERRRERVAAAWGLSDEIVLIGAGEPIGIPGGADQTYPFIAHAEYFWLTGRETPGAILAYDPASGWVDFVPPVTEAERVWEGREDVEGTPLPELAGWLAARRGRRVSALGVPPAGLRFDGPRSEELRTALTHARRPKDEAEIALLRRANAASVRAYAALPGLIRPGVTERAIQVELEAEFYRAGGDRTAYGTIVASGPNAAVLHFAPTARAVRPGDVVLVDAGPEIGRYASDVTRTYRAPGGDDGFFRDLYAVTLALQERAVARCTKGAEWRDVHLGAALDIAAGLAGLGLLRGSAEGLVERDAHALFFPHGLGHLVGLGVRDASGFLPGRVPSTRPGLSRLRTDLPLEPGYCITVEPGIYFIRALLGNPAHRERYRDAVDWSRVDGLMDFGGIRIEDNVLVTEGAPEVLTAAIPKTLESALLA